MSEITISSWVSLAVFVVFGVSHAIIKCRELNMIPTLGGYGYFVKVSASATRVNVVLLTIRRLSIQSIQIHMPISHLIINITCEVIDDRI